LGTGRWLLVFLGFVALLMQSQLWLSDDGFAKTRKLRVAVADQREQNDLLAWRNQALDAEVINLKQGSDAAEERARTDLGMIGTKETFYQVVPPSAAADGESRCTTSRSGLARMAEACSRPQFD